ncbi:MAG: hypothetical protein GF344_19050 [Chitinivibrionales bacterium]|nr:hypothetical protein [Chitinivibrionales bacterium]MBD3358725.1 hypothetical protein [Chitinivibrionales bacterium]
MKRASSAHSRLSLTLFLMLIILMIVVFGQCTCVKRVAATETEASTGTISASILFADSSIAPHVLYRVHIADTINKRVPFRTGITNENGKIILDSVPTGEYFVEIDSDSLGALASLLVYPEGDTTMTIVLAPKAYIIGCIHVPFADRFIPLRGAINEIDRTVSLDSTGFFSIAVPAYDRYTFTIYMGIGSSTTKWIALALDTLGPADTLNIGNISLFSGNVRVRATLKPMVDTMHTARLTVHADDMMPLIKETTVTDSIAYLTATTIPEGLDRILTLEITDATRTTRYRWEDTTDILADSTYEFTPILIPMTEE